MAKAANCTGKTTELRKWLTDLLIASKAYWKGRYVTIAHLYENFSDIAAVITEENGEGTLTAANDILTLTAGGSPSGAFLVQFLPPAYHAFKLTEAYTFLANQDAAVTIRLRLYDRTVTYTTYPTIIDESLDNAGQSRRAEGTDYKDIYIGEGQALWWSASGAIDAGTTCILLANLEVL